MFLFFFFSTAKLIVSWIQRFMKNPKYVWTVVNLMLLRWILLLLRTCNSVQFSSIVLVRLLRATPQTKLFFLGYLVIIHLFLVILLLA